ncbi:hypothetical protein B0H19DRAFT_1112229 [Mycena capillaripes]|nr:hypothetical protein B0H19DRAFT_1112229 [Mycena capillaripes]
MTIYFCDHPPDVILTIFTWCDVSSVVSTAQTCRHLHSLGFEKSVWLALLVDLKRRSFLDEGSTPKLHELSTEELINLVKRILTGPDTWWPSQTEGSFIPNVAKQIVLHPTVTHGEGILTYENEQKLVRGGRHVLFNNNHTLECWSVAEDNLVWTHESGSVLEFAAEVADDGDSLVIMICLERNDENFVDIIYLDCRTGAHTILVQCPILWEYIDNEVEFSSPVICGILCAVAFDPDQDRYQVIDWRSQLSLILRQGEPGLLLLELIPNHIILTLTGTGDDEIRVISADALRAHLAPVSPTSLSDVSCIEIPSLFVHTLASSAFSPPLASVDSLGVLFHRMVVHESPVAAGTYRLWLYASRSRRPKYLSTRTPSPPSCIASHSRVTAGARSVSCAGVKGAPRLRCTSGCMARSRTRGTHMSTAHTGCGRARFFRRSSQSGLGWWSCRV